MIFTIFDIMGTVAFAISGVLVAFSKRLDPFGVFIIAFVTAVGGGTLRDVLIGATPVAWMQDLTTLAVVFGSVVFAIVFRKHLDKLRKSLFLFDTIGLGVFTVIGIEKGIGAELSPVVSVALGAMTGTFGGVLRDILCNEIPVLFRKEIYATACIIGGVGYFVLSSFGLPIFWVASGTVVLVIGVRIVAVLFHLSLPSFYHSGS